MNFQPVNYIANGVLFQLFEPACSTTLSVVDDKLFPLLIAKIDYAYIGIKKLALWKFDLNL